MNGKHLASVILIAVVIGLLQGSLMLKQRMQQAVDSMLDARSRAKSAEKSRDDASKGLDETNRKTAALRTYLSRWQQELERTGTEQRAKNEFGRMVKRFPSLVTFGNNTPAPADNKDMTYLKQRLANGVRLEGDYKKTLQLISAFERELPACRISTVEIRKGQRADDVELDLQVEFPLMAGIAETTKP